MWIISTKHRNFKLILETLSNYNETCLSDKEIKQEKNKVFKGVFKLLH